MKQIIKNKKAKVPLITLKISLRLPKKLKRFRNRLKKIANKK
jgi:hypothetical protein